MMRFSSHFPAIFQPFFAEESSSSALGNFESHGCWWSSPWHVELVGGWCPIIGSGCGTCAVVGYGDFKLMSQFDGWILVGAIESWNSHPEGITLPTVFSSGSWITLAEAVWFRLLEGVSWLCHWKIGPYMDNIKSGNGLQGIICLYRAAWIFASMSAFWDVIALYQAYMCYNSGAQHRYGMGSIMDTIPSIQRCDPRISAETTNISSDTWWNHHSTVWIKHLLTFGASHVLVDCWLISGCGPHPFPQMGWTEDRSYANPYFFWNTGI